MARRKSRKSKTPRRRNSKAINAINVAQTYFQTAIITRAAFRVNPLEFFTGQQTLTRNKASYNATTGTWNQYTVEETGYHPVINGSAMTLPELLGIDDGTRSIDVGGYNPSGNTMEAIRENISLNGGLIKPLVQTAALNAGFTIGKKLLRKQLGITRKVIKAAGFEGMVKV
tara:strand:+ start:3104 stop:3616 length:513 start_codon:yes stop_codon:yes gene_type:complete